MKMNSVAPIVSEIGSTSLLVFVFKAVTPDSPLRVDVVPVSVVASVSSAVEPVTSAAAAITAAATKRAISLISGLSQQTLCSYYYFP